MKRVGRADLLAFLHCWGKGGVEQTAEFVGFYRRPKEVLATKSKEEAVAGVVPIAVGETKVEHRFDDAEPEVHFWRVVAYREKGETGTQADEPSWLARQIPFSGGEIRADHTQPVPSKVPLLPWSKMWPFLFGVLGYYCDTRVIDMERAVGQAARAEPLSHLPFRQRLSWAGTCQVILDMDERLLPFWDDQTGLRQRIEKLRGGSGLEVLVFENGPEGRCRRWGKELGELRPYRLPAPGSPILVISDLGCLDTEVNNKLLRGGQGGSFLEKRPPGIRRQKAWLRFGKRLNRAGFLPTALTLSPARCWDTELARYWRLVSWDRGERLPRRIDRHWAGGRPHSGLTGSSEPGAERLLGLLSAAVRVEPALLRAVRLLLPRWLADVATEAAVWQHKDVHASPIAFAFDSDSIAFYRDGFKKNNPGPLKEQVIDAVKKYHASLSPAVLALEDIIGTALLGKDLESSWGYQFMKQVVKTQYDQTFTEQEGMGCWVDRAVGQVHPGVWEQDSVLTAAWLIRHREEWERGRVSLLPGMDIQKAAWVLGRNRDPLEWVVRRKGGFFLLDPGDWAAVETGDGWDDRGSPVAILTMGNPGLTVGHRGSGIEGNDAVNVEALRPVEIPVPAGGQLTLDTDREQLVIESFTGLEGAIETGRDGWGLSAVVAGDSGERRLYWLNPGKYPVFPLDKKKIKKQRPLSFHSINTGCWLDEAEFYDLRRNGFRQPGWADNIGVDGYGIYADFTIKKVIQRMRLIVPGEFLMGSPGNELERYDDEILHEVMLTRGFWLADTACTQALWQAVLGEKPSGFKGELRPVENVSWNDCQKFITKINGLKPGLELRLPREAEWEYACRAGTQTPFWFGDNITSEQVNYDGNYPYADGEEGNYREETVEVKSLPCNGWGLYQMHGNVLEWCSDWFGNYPEGCVIDPVGPSSGSDRVLRGGSWVGDGGLARSAYRGWFEPAGRSGGTGFRLARGQKEVG